MDTEKKYGLKKPNAIMLFVQMLLVLAGTGLMIYEIYLLIQREMYSYQTWIVFVSGLLTYLAIANYCFIGYKKQKFWFYLPFYFLSASFMFAPASDNAKFIGRLFDIIAFGSLVAASVKLEDKRFVMGSLGLSFVAKLVTFIYMACTIEGQTTINYLIEIQPLILVATIMVCYLTNCHRLEVKNNKK